jgi:hypothetical protein
VLCCTEFCDDVRDEETQLAVDVVVPNWQVVLHITDREKIRYFRAAFGRTEDITGLIATRDLDRRF